MQISCVGYRIGSPAGRFYAEGELFGIVIMILDFRGGEEGLLCGLKGDLYGEDARLGVPN